MDDLIREFLASFLPTLRRYIAPTMVRLEPEEADSDRPPSRECYELEIHLGKYRTSVPLPAAILKNLTESQDMRDHLARSIAHSLVHQGAFAQRNQED